MADHVGQEHRGGDRDDAGHGQHEQLLVDEFRTEEDAAEHGERDDEADQAGEPGAQPVRDEFGDQREEPGERGAGAERPECPARGDTGDRRDAAGDDQAEQGGDRAADEPGAAPAEAGPGPVAERAEQRQRQDRHDRADADDGGERDGLAVRVDLGDPDRERDDLRGQAGEVETERGEDQGRDEKFRLKVARGRPNIIVGRRDRYRRDVGHKGLPSSTFTQ